MLVVLDYITLIIGLIISIIALQKILKSNYSVLHLCVLLFFVIQVFPLFVDSISDLTVIERRTPYEYVAMTETTTGILYDIFCVATLLLLLRFGNKFAKRNAGFRFTPSNRRPNQLVVLLLSLLMFIPLVGVLLSPEPDVYYVFAYFQTQSYSDYSAPALFHNYVMLFIDYIAFFSIIAYYYLKSGTKRCTVLTFIASCLLLWVDGKRGFLALLIVGFIMIDFIKQNSKSYKKLLIKSITLGIVFIAYFVVYGNLTNKVSEESSYINYNAYFSREAEVKMSIYSRSLGENSMLPYDGATIVYDMFAYVPRVFWPDKPYGFFNYLTSFAYYGHGDDFLERSNFQVNIWSEFIANFGVLGYILSVLLVLFIIKKSESSTNKMVKLLGSVFVLTYMFLGFEMIVMLEFYLWVFFLIKASFSRHPKRRYQSIKIEQNQLNVQ